MFIRCLSILMLIPFWAAGQLPCNRLPTADELLQQMQTRPVKELRPRLFSEKCNITDSVKKRLLQLLDWQWMQKEIDNFYTSRIDTAYISKVAKGNKAAWDSLYARFKQEEAANVATITSRVDGYLILIPAKIYMQEAVPLLTKVLTDTIHYPTRYVLLSLARLGNKVAEENIISTCHPSDSLIDLAWLHDAMERVKQLLFVNSQESIAAIHSFLDTTHQFRVSAHGSRQQKSAVEIVWHLSHMIQNTDFQQHANWIEAYNFDTIDDALILYCKEWLEKNRGKYQLNSDYTLY